MHDPEIEARYIQHFTEAVKAVFGTMVRTEVTVEEPRREVVEPRFDISGIIGLSGDITGSVVMSFPRAVAAAVVERFAGCALALECPDFADALGEIVNMVSGSAKARFDFKHVSISTPSIVLGLGHVVSQPTNALCVNLPCSLDAGRFNLGIAVREERGASRHAA